MNAPLVDIPPASRRFNLGDGLILIAAFALVISHLRATDWFARFPSRVGFWADTLSEIQGTTSWDYSSLWQWMSRGKGHLVVAQVVDESLQLLSSLLVGLTLVQPLMRLRSPRPLVRDLARQSGFVVCLAVIVGAFILVDLWFCGIIPDSPILVQAAFLFLLWPILGLYPWKSERSWIDRLGRGIGWGWIVVAASVTALGFL